jgi:CHAT domain-containing protein/tetratricopeptide (TPR) repeat protein
MLKFSPRLFLAILLCTIVTTPAYSQEPLPAQTLEADKPIERELKGGEVHVYSIQLKAGQLIELVVDQSGIDVVASLFAPDGQQLAEADNLKGMQGTEKVGIQAASAGGYELRVASLEKAAKTGRYQVKIITLRNATAQDRARMVARNKYREAVDLERKRDAPSLRLAISAFEEVLPLWRTVGDRQMEADTLAHLANNNAGLNEVPKGIEYFSQAALLYRALGKQAEEADMLTSLGDIHYSQGEMPKALEYLNQALPLRQSSKDVAGEAMTLTSIGGVYEALGQTDKAFATYNRAIPLSQNAGDLRGQAYLLNNVGVLHAKTGQLQKALEFLIQAPPLYHGANALSEESQALTTLAGVYGDLGETQKALEHLDRALPLARQVGDRYAEAYTLSRMGINYDAIGEKQKALDHYKHSLELSRVAGDRRGQANILAFIGAFYSALGEKVQALSYYSQVLELVRSAGDRRSEAGALTNIGQVYAALGDQKQAIDYFNQSLAIRKAINDRLGEARSLGVIGSLYASTGEIEKGVDALIQSLKIRREIGDRAGEASALTRLGIASRDTNDKEKALKQFDEALSLWRTVGDRGSEASVLYNIAGVFLERDELLKGRESIEAAVTIAESVRNKFASQDMRTSYSASVQQYYRLNIDLLMRLHKERPADGYAAMAFQLSERARARTLLESLGEARADLRQGIDKQLLESERNILQKLNARTERQARLLGRKDASGQLAALQNEITKLATEYQDVQTEIRRKSPRYAALTQPVPLTVRDVQNDLLDADTALLEYALGEKRSYLWLVTKTSLNSYELPKGAEIDEAARRVYELLSDGQSWTRSGNLDAKYTKAAQTLSDMLLAPAFNQLAGKRLVVVSDGTLQYIPFSGLPIPQESKRTKKRGAQGSSDQPLAAAFEIVSLPSASTLPILRREIANRPRASKTVAVFADPVFGEDDSRLAAVKIGPPNTDPKGGQHSALVRAYSWRDDGPLIFPRLPFTRREAEGILSVSPPGSGLKALDFQANRETALSKELGDYRIVHFATHGLLQSEHPDLSGIVLSLVDDQGRPVDGFLRLNEIYNLDLSADLVVLSACQTALGKDVKGEGLIGLTRGFMYAGSPRVVASLWKVDDVATAELMKIFYQKMLKEKMRPAAALQAAKIAMWKTKRWNSPYYWAAFELQGDWR